MAVVVVVIAVGLLAVLARGVHVAVAPGVATRTCFALGRRVGLDVDALVLEAVRPRVARRALVGAVGGAVGGTAIGWWFAAEAVGTDRGPTVLVWAVMAAVLGRSVALAGLALAEGAARPGGRSGPRVARVRIPMLGDYVPPAETAFAATLALLPAALLLVGSLADGAPSAGPWVSAAIGLAALSLGVVAARGLTVAPRRAGTPLVLAWDDALRALALRDLTAAVAVAGASYALLSTSVFAMVPAPEEVRAAVNVWATVVLWIPAAVAAILAVRSRPGARFRRRLWPDPPRARTDLAVTS